MDELIQQVTQRTGVSPEKAREVVDMVLKFVKGKLPAPLAAQLDQVVSGQGAAGLGDAAKSLGGLFGK